MVLYTLVPFEIGSFMILMIPHYALDHHHRPLTFGEKIVHGLAVFLRILADLFFRERYGHRAVFIETIAAIPGMVGGALLHFRCLRKIKEDEGWIRRLLEEAENERMHLMAFIHIAKPTWLERVLIYMVQFLFIGSYFLLYVLSSRLAHRFVGYLEEEAIHSYSQYLKKVLTRGQKRMWKQASQTSLFSRTVLRRGKISLFFPSLLNSRSKLLI